MGKLERHPKGYHVTFKNPATGKLVRGQILDEVWAREPENFADTAPSNDGWREGAHVAQFIDWGQGYRSVWIAYYLRPESGGPDTGYFGGQYSSLMSLKDFRALRRKLCKKGWCQFRPLWLGWGVAPRRVTIGGAKALHPHVSKTLSFQCPDSPCMGNQAALEIRT